MNTNSSQHWAKLGERGSSLGLTIMLKSYKWFGKPVFSLILLFVTGYFYLSGKTQRDAILAYQKRVKALKPDFVISPYKQFLSFGFSILDKVSAWSGDIAYNDVDFADLELMREAVNSGEGGVILVSHHGNMEICRALSREVPNLKINVFVHTKNAVKFNNLISSVTKDYTLNLTEVTELGPETAILMADKVAQGEFVVIVGDRVSVNHSSRVVTADFLGETADFPQGPFVLAALMKCPVYFMCCIKIGRRYRVDFQRYADKLVLPRKEREAALKQVVQGYADWLQGQVLMSPLQWFNFFDFWEKK